MNQQERDELRKKHHARKADVPNHPLYCALCGEWVGSDYGSVAYPCDVIRLLDDYEQSRNGQVTGLETEKCDHADEWDTPYSPEWAYGYAFCPDCGKKL
jgi:hypothetical protein